MTINAKEWLAAEDATAGHRSLVQGFLYQPKDAPEGMTDLHVVRDCTKPLDQVIWYKWATPAEYDAAHEAMLFAIRIENVRIIVEYYERPCAAEAAA